jgi:hypothetical protein
MALVVSPVGDHTYVPPAVEGEAVSVALSPIHMTGLLTLTVGS